MAKRRSSTNKRRKGFLSVALPWVQRFGALLTGLVVVLWVVAWLFLSGAVANSLDWTKNQIVVTSGKAGFTTEALLLEGRHYADIDFLRALINVQPGDPLFSLSPSRAKILLEETEWVRHAHVERRLPGTIYIKIQERRPTALWLKDGALYLVDEDGAEIKTDRLERFSDLMIVSGDGGPAKVYTLAKILSSKPDLAERVRTAERVERRRWDLTLRNGLVIKLPEDENIGLALERIEKAHVESQLLDRPGLQVVDTRQDDRLVIRNRPGMARVPAMAIPPPPKVQRKSKLSNGGNI